MGAEHLPGIAGFSIVMTSWAWSSWRWRRAVLPAWHGPIGVLAQATAALAAVTFLGIALGVAGLLQPLPLVLASAILGIGSGLVASATPHPAAGATTDTELAPRTARSCAIGVSYASIAVVAHLRAVWELLRGGGIVDYDSLWYHLPVAADFARAGRITDVVDVGNPPTSYFPFDGELLHAIGIVLLDHDLTSVVMNLGWLLLALLAAWCIGEPSGRGGLTTGAMALVATMPLTILSQAGTANVDLAVLALCAAAVAFLLRRPPLRGGVALASVTVGLLVGIKISAVPLVIAALVVVTARAHRRFAVASLVASVTCLSSVWYVRNLVTTGHPLPSLGVSLPFFELTRAVPDPVDCSPDNVLAWTGRWDAVRRTMVPELSWAYGTWWPAVLALGVAGPVVVLVRPRLVRPPELSAAAPARVLAVASVGLWSGYLLTPGTGGLHAGSLGPTCFGYNQRFAMAAVALGLLCVLLALPDRRPTVLHGGVVILLLLNLVDRGVGGAIASAIAGVVVGAAVHFRSVHRLAMAKSPDGAPARFLGLLGIAGVLVVLGSVASEEYLERRYDDTYFEEPLTEAARWAGRQSGARIATAGFLLRAPLHGSGADNLVAFVPDPAETDPFSRATTCDDWRTALVEGRFTHVVLAPGTIGGDTPAEDAWVRDDPRATLLFSDGPTRVYELDEDVRPTPCR